MSSILFSIRKQGACALTEHVGDSSSSAVNSPAASVQHSGRGGKGVVTADMREKDSRESRSASASGQRFMNSAQVKQTIYKLDKDGDTRRNGLNSLKQHVEAMDSASVPRFITQVSEAKESSRAYAISLYEDVARVHGKLMIPHIPRVMTTVTKSLSSSGSSPQLQQACAKVISAVAKYAIDEGSPALASEILRDLCNPLLEVLCVKLEPLAAGAAICLLTLVESDKWKFASSAVVEDLCLKTTVALSEKGTRTVSHMQLARSLAISNSSFLASYGVTLLQSGVEVLRSSATSASWQQKASAARLLTAVLPTADRATLSEELNPTVQALDECKHDRISNVRWAVKEALKTAKGVLSEENSRRSSDGDELLAWMNVAPAEPSTSSPLHGRRSSLGGISSDDMMSPPGWGNSRRNSLSSYPKGSPVSSVIPLSPSAPSGSPRSRAAAVAAALASDELLPLRSHLQATKLQSSSKVGSTFDSSAISFNDLESPRKENWPSHDSDTKMGGAQAFDADLSLCKPSANEGDAAQSPSPTSGVTFQHSFDSDLGPMVAASEGHEENSPFSPDPLSSLLGDRDNVGGDLDQEEDMFLLSNGETPQKQSRHESTGQFNTKSSSRDSGGMKDSPVNNSGSFRGSGYHGVLNGSTMKHVFELKGPALRSSPRAKDDESVSSTVGLSPLKNNIGDRKEASSNGHLGSPMRTNSPVPLTPFEDSFSPQSEGSKPLIAAEDFLPFSTPRRLVRSLQESFGSPQTMSSPARYAEHDSSRVREEEDFGERISTNDMDLGTPTSTGTGWSVRTNPIASDESAITESDDSDCEQGRKSTDWKKMVLDPSTSATPSAPHTPPAQETDNSDISDGLRHRLNHSSLAAAALIHQDEPSQQGFCLDYTGNFSRSPSGEIAEDVKPELLSNEVEIERMSGGNGELAQFESGFTTLGGNGNGVDKWSCRDSESPRSEVDNGVATISDIIPESETGSETGTMSVEVVSVVKDNSKTNSFTLTRRKSMSRSWREWLNQTVFSWQTCFVIVAIPFAIALAKVVIPSDPRFTVYLVPT